MVIYSIKEANGGRWSVCRLNLALFSGLSMVDAIQLAREVARDEFLRSGRDTLVEMPGPHTMIVLGRYTRPVEPAIGNGSIAA